MTLSQLLPALTFLRSAVSSGPQPRVKARPLTKERPKKTQAFHQARRPADTKRKIAVTATLEQTETKDRVIR